MNSRKPGMFENWSDAAVFLVWCVGAYAVVVGTVWVAWVVVR